MAGSAGNARKSAALKSDRPLQATAYGRIGSRKHGGPTPSAGKSPAHSPPFSGRSPARRHEHGEARARVSNEGEHSADKSNGLPLRYVSTCEATTPNPTFVATKWAPPHCYVLDEQCIALDNEHGHITDMLCLWLLSLQKLRPHRRLEVAIEPQLRDYIAIHFADEPEVAYEKYGTYVPYRSRAWEQLGACTGMSKTKLEGGALMWALRRVDKGRYALSDALFARYFSLYEFIDYHKYHYGDVSDVEWLHGMFNSLCDLIDNRDTGREGHSGGITLHWQLCPTASIYIEADTGASDTGIVPAVKSSSTTIGVTIANLPEPREVDVPSDAPTICTPVYSLTTVTEAAPIEPFTVNATSGDMRISTHTTTAVEIQAVTESVVSADTVSIDTHSVSIETHLLVVTMPISPHVTDDTHRELTDIKSAVEHNTSSSCIYGDVKIAPDEDIAGVDGLGLLPVVHMYDCSTIVCMPPRLLVRVFLFRKLTGGGIDTDLTIGESVLEQTYNGVDRLGKTVRSTSVPIFASPLTRRTNGIGTYARLKTCNHMVAHTRPRVL